MLFGGAPQNLLEVFTAGVIGVVVGVPVGIGVDIVVDRVIAWLSAVLKAPPTATKK